MSDSDVKEAGPTGLEEHRYSKRLDHAFGELLAPIGAAPRSAPDVAKARTRLFACKHYCDLALLELPEDPAGQDPGAAAEQAADASDQLAAALAALTGAAG